MPKLDTASLQAILTAERSDALAATTSSQLSNERTKAMDYYNSDMTDMVPPEGRSKAVSADVMETIEGLMPTLMEIFCGSDQVVKFAPVSAEDEKASEQETDYVNHVFMEKNSGFLVLYSFIKDALLSKVGIVKVFWAEEERESTETYEDLTDGQLAMLLNNPKIDIVAHTVKDAPGYAGS